VGQAIDDEPAVVAAEQAEVVHDPVGQAGVELELRGGDALPVLGGALGHGGEGGALRLGRGHPFHRMARGR
jgi:hypothetical protein